MLEKDDQYFCTTIHNATNKINNVVRNLCLLSDAFSMIGMDVMASNLNKQINTLSELSEEIDKAVSKEVHERMVQSQESSANMMRAILGGIELGKKENVR